MRHLFLIPFMIAGAAEARELSGRDARAIVTQGDILTSGTGDPPPWLDRAENSPHLYLLVAYEDEVYLCNVGASNLGNRADLTCRKDAR